MEDKLPEKKFHISMTTAASIVTASEDVANAVANGRLDHNRGSVVLRCIRVPLELAKLAIQMNQNINKSGHPPFVDIPILESGGKPIKRGILKE